MTEVCQAPSAPLVFLVSQGRLDPQARCVVLYPVVPISTRPCCPDCSEAGRKPIHGSLRALPFVHEGWVLLCHLYVF